MAIAQLPERIPSAVRKSVHEWKGRIDSLRSGENWMHPLAVGSLIAGAVLLARGKRKAGLAVSAAGAAMALLEDPEHAAAVWKSVPSYILAGKRLLAQAEGFVEDLGKQGDKVRTLLDRAQRR